MTRVVRFMMLCVCLVLAACQSTAPTEPTFTVTTTKTPWPTRTSTQTPVPPTATPTPTITPVYPTPTLSFIFTALDTSTWLEFASPKYNFAFYYPADWNLTLDENEESETYQHLIWILPDEQQPRALITIGFSGLDEHVCVERVSGGSGELVVHGKISVLGEPITRELLVLDGKYLAVLYNGAAELRRHELVLTLALEYLGENTDQEALTEEQILIADQIMASIRWIEAPTATPTITPSITATPSSTVTPTRDPSITVTVTPTLDPSITVTATPTVTTTTSAYP